MVQEFMILRCFSCATFQVHQVKKSRKWVCKVCGEKQSIKNVFMQGSGQECRKQVQQLNMKRGTTLQAMDLSFVNCKLTVDSDCLENGQTFEKNNCMQEKPSLNFSTGGSKWGKFLSPTDTNIMESEEPDDFTVTTERNVFDRASFKRKQNATKNGNKDFKQKKFRKDVQQNCTKNYQANETVSNQFVDSGGVISNTKTQTQFLPGFCFNGVAPQERRASFSSVCSSDSSRKLDKLHFAQATRNAVSATKGEVNKKQWQGSMKYSKWTQFMSSSSTQNSTGGEIDDGNHSQPSLLDTHTLKSSGSDIHAEQHEESQEVGTLPSRVAKHVNLGATQTQKVQLQDLFNIEDDFSNDW